MGFKSLSVEEAVKSIENGALIVDVREQSEYEEAHLNNGILVPLSTISAEKITEINPDNRTILIHCRSGKRSKVAANILLSQNYTGEILELDEGINAWMESNQPIISGI